MGRSIGTQELFDDDPGHLLHVEMPIPESLTHGREQVRVGFRPVASGVDRSDLRRAHPGRAGRGMTRHGQGESERR